jgi:rRNA processing protein Gar1
LHILFDMKSECTIIHTFNNEILLKTDDCIGVHNKLVNEHDVVVGKITKILGPVKAPYALAYISGKDLDIQKIYVKC